MKSREVFEMFGLDGGDGQLIVGVCDANYPAPFHLCFSSDTGIQPRTRALENPETLFIVPCVEGVEWPHNCLPVPSPRRAYAVASRAIVRTLSSKDIASTAQVHSDARIGEGVTIGHFTVIDAGVSIGPDSIIGSHVHLHDGVRIGTACEIADHTSIGTSGFGFEVDDQGRPIRIAHIGGVSIGDRVEIGTHVAIAQGTFNPTRIADDVKIDDAVFIAHNVRIGARSLVIAGATICGSAVIGSDAWISPASTVINKAVVGDGALVGLGAVVVKDVEPATVVAGVPAKSRGPRK